VEPPVSNGSSRSGLNLSIGGKRTLASLVSVSPADYGLLDGDDFS